MCFSTAHSDDQLLSRSTVANKNPTPRGELQSPISHEGGVPFYERSSFPPPGVPLRHAEDFLLTRRLGTGKFSDVFEAVDTNLAAQFKVPSSRIDPRTIVVIKCLKPVSERKVRREVAVLNQANQLTNVARLLGVVLHPTFDNNCHRYPPKMPALILEHAGPHSRWLCHGLTSTHSDDGEHRAPLTDYEIRYYLYHLLVALAELHRGGVMHRDVKPRNVLINRRGRATHRPLMLIDLGLADFVVPNTPYNVRVASRHYKSPELLVGYEYYTTSIDLWGVGCILAGLLLQREPVFRGRDNDDQLTKIVAVLGTGDFVTYLQKYNISFDLETFLKGDPHLPALRQDWSMCRGESFNDPISLQGLDLLDKLLVYDHNLRYTAEQAMAHAFFDPVRSRVEGEVTTYAWNVQQLASRRYGKSSALSFLSQATP